MYPGVLTVSFCPASCAAANRAVAKSVKRPLIVRNYITEPGHRKCWTLGRRGESGRERLARNDSYCFSVFRTKNQEGRAAAPRPPRPFSGSTLYWKPNQISGSSFDWKMPKRTPGRTGSKRRGEFFWRSPCLRGAAGLAARCPHRDQASPWWGLVAHCGVSNSRAAGWATALGFNLINPYTLILRS